MIYSSGSQTVWRDPQGGGGEGLERGAQHTFLQKQKIKIHIEKLLISTGFNYHEIQSN
jgi:hypothetical protein